MPRPSWPNMIPQVMESDGYEETPPASTLRTQMEDAVPVVRRLGRDGVSLLNGVIVMPAAQARILDDFYRTTLSYGALPFVWPACPFRVGSAELIQYNSFDEVKDFDLLIDFDNLIGYSAVSDPICRFVRPPRYSAPDGINVAATLELEILP